MGMRDDIQSALTEAFADELSDVVINFDFIVETEQTTFDVDADTYHPLKVDKSSKGIMQKIDERLVDGINIQIRDQFLVVNGVDVPAGVVPEVDMEIKLTDGTKYRIMEPGKVPGGDGPAIVYKMRVRRNG